MADGARRWALVSGLFNCEFGAFLRPLNFIAVYFSTFYELLVTLYF